MQITHTIPDASMDDVSAQFESRTPRRLGDPGRPAEAGDPGATPPIPAVAAIAPTPDETTVAHVTRAVAEWMDGELGAAAKVGAGRQLAAERAKATPSAAKIKQYLDVLDPVPQP